MFVVNKLNIPKEDQTEEKVKDELSWENPSDPENAADNRDIEQLQRQKREADLRKNNLSDNEQD